MNRTKILFLSAVFFLIGCGTSLNNNDIKKWKAEIIAVEKEFNDLEQQEGIVRAFATQLLQV